MSNPEDDIVPDVMDLVEDCFECLDGHYVDCYQDYGVILRDGERVDIPDVVVMVCNHCGHTSLDDRALLKIESYIGTIRPGYYGRQKRKSK